MPYHSRWSLPIPNCSLPTLLFESATRVEPPELANKQCYIDANDPNTQYFTRATYKLWAQRLALGITRLPSFKAGDRILIFSATSLCFPVAFMGVVMAGGVFTAANPSFTARELAHQLRDSGASYVFVMDASLETAVEAATTVGLPLDRVRQLDASVFFGTPSKTEKNGVQSWGSIFASEKEGKKYQWADLKGLNEAKDTLLALNYSSGTTGVPKGVMITHRNYVSNCLQHQHLATLRSDYKERNERARWLCYLPMYHAMAQTIFLSGAVMRHVPVYLMSKFDFIQVLQAIEKFRITEFSMVPPIAVMVAKHPAVKKYDLSSIDTIGSGAAPLGSEASRELEKVWNGRLNLKQGWGMTEVTCSLLGWDPNKYSSSFGVGEPNANCSAKIMKITENPTNSNTESFTEVTARGPDNLGEVWVKGPNIMKGYWNNEKATKETFSPDGEWLRTGDIAYVDEEGHFFIVDRIKELIKVKGNQVAPAELEALILDHPGVSDVAVIGLQAADGEEKPRAYCVRQHGEAGQKVTENDIAKFVADKVIRYKRLSGGVEFVDAIPKNPSGKILRRQLRDMAKKKESRSEGAKL